MRMQFSSKRLQISKANTQMVLVVGIAAFVTTFSLVASQSLFSQRSYQAKVMSKKEAAVSQLRSNTTEVVPLTEAYQAFEEQFPNIIGGNPEGTGDKDGDNAKIVLDALPSKYDFPGLASSIEKMLSNQNFQIESITGTDDSESQTEEASANPIPVEMPFEFSVKGNFTSMGELLSILKRSIRPFEVRELFFDSDGADQLTLTVKGVTYYQPAKTLGITTEVVQQ